jgi:hypothetical protein
MVYLHHPIKRVLRKKGGSLFLGRNLLFNKLDKKGKVFVPGTIIFHTLGEAMNFYQKVSKQLDFEDWKHLQCMTQGRISRSHIFKEHNSMRQV